MRYNKRICFILYIIAALLLCSCGKYRLREGEYEWELEFYGEEIYSELRIEMTPEDRAELQPLVDDIEAALSAVYEPDTDADSKYGKLAHYSFARDGFGAVSSETHELEVLTGKTDGNTAVLWIRYNHTGYNADGERITSCSVNTSRITAEKTDGKWTAVRIMEHP